MSNFKQNELIITLSCKGRDLYSLNTKDFVEEVSIGRNSDCTWSVGNVDTATSNRHAIISKRKNDFYLTDLGSRNGVFLNDRKIKEIKLAPGMTLRFGECSVTVTDPSARQVKKITPCYLRYSDENGKSCRYRIMEENVRIGANDKCDIILNSSLVSTPHAVLSRKNDGSCWLRDLNSRNGTAVNGLELPAKVERMLKNGDVISIADFEMTYHDGSSERHTLKLTAALLTLVITALACVGGYFFWLQFTPASQEFLKQARSAARRADFAAARRLTAFAATARKSGETQAERRLFLSQVDTWENSSQRRIKLYSLLDKKRFQDVAQLIGTMDLEYISSWDWNEKNAVQLKQELELIKKSFSCFNRVEMIFNDSEAQPAELEGLRSEIQKTAASLRRSQGTGVQNVVKFSENITRKITAVLKAQDSFQKLLHSFGTAGAVNIEKSIENLEKLQKNFPLPFIAGRSASVLPVLYAVQSSEKQLAGIQKLFCDMRFRECVSSEFIVPENTMQITGIDRRIEKLKKESADLKNMASHLDVLYGSLKRQNITLGKTIPTLEAFLNTKELAQVFKCDTLRLAPASKNRKTPRGQYDKYVGIEYLYGTLAMLRSNEIVRSRYIIPFEPLLERAVFHLGMVNYFREFAAANCRKYIGKGKLGRYVKYLDGQLQLRDRIVKDMLRRAAAARKGTRGYFIAHGIAYALKPQSYTLDQREKISREFSAFRVKLQDLNRKYNTVLPQEAIQIREQVLREGLPGDPVVKRMWSLR